MNRVGILYAFAAAVLFGLSTPLAKLLLGSIDPMLLAGLFYFGSGLGLAVVRVVQVGQTSAPEAKLAGSDVPWLGGAILCGGLIGPMLLMIGLSSTPASIASLLLTVEGAATALIAWIVFRENFDRRIALGMACIVVGAAILSYRGGASFTDAFGPLAIIGACVAWGIDNNLTRKVSLADPVEIAMLKGLIAGAVNLTIAFTMGAHLPNWDVTVAAGLVGFFGYGVSLVMFVLALRHLGTARTGAYFSTAPFLGSVVAVFLNGEPLSFQLSAAGVFMAIGIWLHLTERHEHEHEHEALEHEHRHTHDIHHQHAHGPNDPSGELHSHRHAHIRLRHSHAHVPDSHHRHVH